MNSDIGALIAAERMRAADMFEELSEAQWVTPSLCSRWTIRELAAHMTLLFNMSAVRFGFGLLAARGNIDRLLDRASRDLAKRPTAEIIADLRRNAGNRRIPPGGTLQGPLSDVAIHTRDAARPLGLDVTAPVTTWREVLDFLTSSAARRGFVPAGRLSGLNLQATDQDWSAGQGAEIAGPSEALALAAAGRAVALDDLVGDGVALLEARL